LKKLRKHITTWFLLLLIVIYVSPFQYFHECHRQAHHEKTDSIDEEHEICHICDIQLQNFNAIESFQISFLPKVYTNFDCETLIHYTPCFKHTFFNKGPPSKVFLV